MTIKMPKIDPASRFGRAIDSGKKAASEYNKAVKDGFPGLPSTAGVVFIEGFIKGLKTDSME